MVTTAKILNELKAGGMIEEWSCVREARGNTKETYFKVRSEHVSISHEIYGRKAVMYFSCEKDEAVTAAVQAAVRRAGGKVDTAWTIRDRFDCFSVPVSYFKGPRWWE